ncbi:MAG: hypothetical protein JNM39_11005 [Bdellovibrionaceae bacterium]|nr:hypothetical protein [Pseudobdellovibrionaceae bacterium]
MRTVILISLLLCGFSASHAQDDNVLRDMMAQVQSARPSGLLLKPSFESEGETAFSAEVLGQKRSFTFTFGMSESTFTLQVDSLLAPYSPQTLQAICKSVGSLDKVRSLENPSKEVIIYTAETQGEIVEIGQKLLTEINRRLY